jgi:tetratricopeptide (TPR) repeat protein
MRILWSGLLVAFLWVPLALAHEEDAGEAPVVVANTLGDVGDVSFSISCEGEDVGSRFDRAVALLHHMTYEVAEIEFAAIAKRDESCAMAHWGIAMTRVHPVWPGQPAPEDLQRGASAIARARSLEKTEREGGYVEALAAFYDDWDSVDHLSRIRRWDEAQAALRDRFPSDDDAQAFAALLHVAASPKDDLEYRFNREAGAAMAALFARKPRHPGGIHYLIHAYDSPPLAAQALDAARAYEAIAPAVPHALHMPTHIFTRLGLWMDSAAWNLRSREAARNLLVDGRVYGEFAHASDYMTYAYLQAGQDAAARGAAEALFAVEKLQDYFVSAYGLAAVPARIAIELSDWAEAARLEPRRPGNLSWDDYPACEAIIHFARGLGAARTGQVDAARASSKRLRELVRALDAQGDGYWSQQVTAQRMSVDAWIAHASGQGDAAIRLMEKAAAAEDALDKHPVTPGSVVPARELYAQMLADAERFEEAFDAYVETLQVSPNRFNSLAGAASTAERLGRTSQARGYYERLIEVAGSGETDRTGLADARAFLERIALD